MKFKEGVFTGGGNDRIRSNSEATRSIIRQVKIPGIARAYVDRGSMRKE